MTSPFDELARQQAKEVKKASAVAAAALDFWRAEGVPWVDAIVSTRFRPGRGLEIRVPGGAVLYAVDRDLRDGLERRTIAAIKHSCPRIFTKAEG